MPTTGKTSSKNFLIVHLKKKELGKDGNDPRIPRKEKKKRKGRMNARNPKIIIVASSGARSRFSHLPHDRKVAALSGIDSKAKKFPLRANQVIMAIEK
jgi:hypothetical protein